MDDVMTCVDTRGQRRLGYQVDLVGSAADPSLQQTPLHQTHLQQIQTHLQQAHLEQTPLHQTCRPSGGHHFR
ncbi:unnamed protein product [Merluccius merluccius]